VLLASGDRNALTAGDVIHLQRQAGNRAVAQLLSSRGRRPAVQRCGGEVHAGCPCAEEQGKSGQQAEEHVQRSDASGETGSQGLGVPCALKPGGGIELGDFPGTLPNAKEWMSEPWLCQMHRESWGSNAKLLAVGAKGRSVELLHHALQHWICYKTKNGEPPKHLLADWKSSNFTEATKLVVKDFQADHRTVIGPEGIVGPETLSILDGYVGANPKDLPSDCKPKPKTEPGPTPDHPGCDDCCSAKHLYSSQRCGYGMKQPDFDFDGRRVTPGRVGCGPLCQEHKEPWKPKPPSQDRSKTWEISMPEVKIDRLTPTVPKVPGWLKKVPIPGPLKKFPGLPVSLFGIHAKVLIREPNKGWLGHYEFTGKSAGTSLRPFCDMQPMALVDWKPFTLDRDATLKSFTSHGGRYSIAKYLGATFNFFPKNVTIYGHWDGHWEHVSVTWGGAESNCVTAFQGLPAAGHLYKVVG
jgi:hypothetical protein